MFSKCFYCGKVIWPFQQGFLTGHAIHTKCALARMFWILDGATDSLRERIYEAKKEYEDKGIKDLNIPKE